MPRGPAPTDKSEEIVDALRESDRPFMGTGELADALGYESNPGVKKHLDRAYEAGEIEMTSISGYNIWYLPNLESADPEAVADGGLFDLLTPAETFIADVGLFVGKVAAAVLALAVILIPLNITYTNQLAQVFAVLFGVNILMVEAVLYRASRAAGREWEFWKRYDPRRTWRRLVTGTNVLVKSIGENGKAIEGGSRQ